MDIARSYMLQLLDEEEERDTIIEACAREEERLLQRNPSRPHKNFDVSLTYTRDHPWSASSIKRYAVMPEFDVRRFEGGIKDPTVAALYKNVMQTIFRLTKRKR